MTALNIETSFLNKIYSLFFMQDSLKEEYSYDDLSDELLLKIINKCDKKTWLKLRDVSKNFYRICSDNSLKYSVRNCVKKELKTYFFDNKDMLDDDSFVLTYKTICAPRNFYDMCNSLNDYFVKNKEWVDNQKLHKIHYYFILYFVRDCILHNQKLDYIKIHENDSWECGEKPQSLIDLQKCFALLKKHFTFPLVFTLDGQEYFLDLPKIEEVGLIYNPWIIQMISGKNNKRNAEVMYYDYYLSQENGKVDFFGNTNFKKPNIKHLNRFSVDEYTYYQDVWRTYSRWNNKNYIIKSLSLIVNMDRKSGYLLLCYVKPIYDKIFKIITKENIKYLTIVEAGTIDKTCWREKEDEFRYLDEISILREEYSNLKQVFLKNNNTHTSFFKKL